MVRKCKLFKMVSESLFNDIHWDTDPRSTEFYNSVSGLSKHRIGVIRKACTAAINDNFKRGYSEPLYGMLPKNMSLEQLKKFFSAIDNDEYKAIFLMQLALGLRAGEIKSIEFLEDQNLVRIQNTKCNRTDYLPMSDFLKKILDKYGEVKKYGYKAIAKWFRIYRERAGLNYVYAHDPNGKPLYQFSTHSIRHTAITFFEDYIENPLKTSTFSRHSKRKLFGVVSVYCHYSMDSLKKDLDSAFKVFEELII